MCVNTYICEYIRFHWAPTKFTFASTEFSEACIVLESGKGWLTYKAAGESNSKIVFWYFGLWNYPKGGLAVRYWRPHFSKANTQQWAIEYCLKEYWLAAIPTGTFLIIELKIWARFLVVGLYFGVYLNTSSN